MEFEVLPCLPLSGEYEEYQHGVGDEFIAVKVMDDNGLEYCAKFSVGGGSKTVVKNLGSVIFFISQGKGYLFDLNQRRLIKDTKIENFTDVFVSDEKRYFVAHNNTDIYIYDCDGLIWSSGRISSDGIIVKSVDGGGITGQIFDFMDWVNFKLDFENFNYECSWTCPFD